MIFFILSAYILFHGITEVAAFPHNGPASSYEEADSEFLNGRPAFLDDHNWNFKPYIGEYYVPKIDGEPIYIPPLVSQSHSHAPIESENKKPKESLASVYDDFLKQSLLLDPVSPIDNEYPNGFVESPDKKGNKNAQTAAHTSNKPGYDETFDQGSAMGPVKENKESTDGANADFSISNELHEEKGSDKNEPKYDYAVGDYVKVAKPVHIDDSTLEIDLSTTMEDLDYVDFVDEIGNTKQNSKIAEKEYEHNAKEEEKADKHKSKEEEKADKHKVKKEEKADKHKAKEEEKADKHKAKEEEKEDKDKAKEEEKVDKHIVKLEVKHNIEVQIKTQNQNAKMEKSEKQEAKKDKHNTKEQEKADEHDAKMKEKVKKQNAKLAENNVQIKDGQKGRSYDGEINDGKGTYDADEHDAIKKLPSNNFEYQDSAEKGQSSDKTIEQENDESERLSFYHIDTNLNHNMDLEADESHSLVGSLDSSLRSLVFNPKVQTLQSFQSCITRSNETGICTSVQHCSVPNAANTLEQLMNNACVIEGAFIGVCCPEFPVESVKVEWGEDFSIVDNQELSRSDSISCGLKSEEYSDSWPWLAPLISMASGQIFCGGALITDRYVLTAAHCTTKIPKNQILVRLGQRNTGNPEDSSGEDYAVVEIKRHANYDRRTLQNDIALLKLARRVPLGNFQRTVCLPDKTSHVGNEATLVGWRGISGDSIKGKLVEESLTVLSNEKCEIVQGFEVPSSLLCTMARNEETRTCNADSGVPLVMAHHDKYEVLAVLSWDRNDCDSRYPSVFTRVSYYKNWIKKHVQE